MPPTRLNPLDKKTPTNPRFANVKPKLVRRLDGGDVCGSAWHAIDHLPQRTQDTGPNMRKILEQYQGTSGPNAHKKKADEFYVRLRPTTLGKLLLPLVEAQVRSSHSTLHATAPCHRPMHAFSLYRRASINWDVKTLRQWHPSYPTRVPARAKGIS